MLWDNFALLAPMALLTTHERANVGVVRERRRDELVPVIGEIAAVAAAGRPLELEALGGAVLRRAAKHGVPVPVTSRLVDELQSESKGSTR